MRLRRLQIENFRGVKALDWRHIAVTAALVGPGDSGKSTILDAIERVLSPKWNVPFDDTDFWDLHTGAPIIIRATITDLAPSFYRDSKFGLLLHGFDTTTGEAVRASGDEGEEHALVVELRVDASLEPGELPGPVRERAQPETRGEVERATPDRSVSVPRVEDDVAVQQACRNARRLAIEDLRTDGDPADVRDCNRAPVSRVAHVLRALLDDTEFSRSFR